MPIVVLKRRQFPMRKQCEALPLPRESTRLKNNFWFAPELQAARLVSFERAHDGLAALDGEGADWNRIKGSKTPYDFYAQLYKYPSGPISEQAPLNLDPLQRVGVRP